MSAAGEIPGRVAARRNPYRATKPGGTLSVIVIFGGPLYQRAGARDLDPGPFEEFARAYTEHLYAPAPRADVRGPYRRAVQELENPPRWRCLLGTFNPASLAKTLEREMRTQAAGGRRAFCRVALARRFLFRGRDRDG